jgi:hypothetical protein
VLPLFVLKHLLPQAVMVHKADLDTELPPFTEIPVLIKPAKDDTSGQELITEYTRLQRELVAQIKADMFNGELAGKLFGQMAELPGYLDLASAECGNRAGRDGSRVYEVRYPESVGGSLAVASPKLFAQDCILPKERWLLSTLRTELAEGRRTLIFVRHTGPGAGSGGGGGGGKEPPLVKRLCRLIKAELGEEAVYLDSAKVKAADRKDWLDREVIGRRRRVLILNPDTVKTGLNNLIFFCYSDMVRVELQRFDLSAS